MRELIQLFEERKKTFSNAVSDFSLRLPEPLNRMAVPGRGGEGEIIVYKYASTLNLFVVTSLTLLRDDMKKFIDPCVNGLIKLIQSQIKEVEDVKHRRVKVRSHNASVEGLTANTNRTYLLLEDLVHHRICRKN